MAKYEGSFKQKCIEAGLSEKDVLNARAYQKKYNLSDEVVINRYLHPPITLKQQCNKAGINYTKAKTIKYEYPDLSFNQIAYYVSNPNEYKKYKGLDPVNLLELSKKYHVACQTLKKLKKKYNCSNEELVPYIKDFIKQRDKKSLRQKCKEAGVKYLPVYKYMKLHSIAEDDAIQVYLDSKQKGTFTDKCRRYNIDAITALNYRATHKHLTDTQVLLHYRPDLKVNIFGEIVEE